jgi:uncharacterized membrane protein
MKMAFVAIIAVDSTVRLMFLGLVIILLAYFPEMEIGLRDHHPFCACVCPPINF